MQISKSKYYVYFLKIVIGILLSVTLFSFYNFTFMVNNQFFGLVLHLISYFDFIFLSMIFMGLFRSYTRLYTTFIILAPFIPTFVFSYMLINTIPSEYTLYVFPFSFLCYSFFFALTRFILNIMSFRINVRLLGKDSIHSGYDYRCISIYTRDIYKDHISFFQHIIKNVLGYSDEFVETIKVNNLEYKLIDFSKKISPTYFGHLILIPIECFDINYVNWLKETKENVLSPICPSLSSTNEDIDYSVIDEESERDLLYSGFYIYQYFEDGDKLYEGNIYDDVLLTFANILSNTDRNICYENHKVIFDDLEPQKKSKDSIKLIRRYLITNYKKDDIASMELYDLKGKIYWNHINRKYKAYIDMFFEYIIEVLKKKHTKTILGIIFLILVIIGFIYALYVFTGDLAATITVFFAIPAGLYALVALYDRFNPKNKSKSTERSDK